MSRYAEVTITLDYFSVDDIIDFVVDNGLARRVEIAARGGDGDNYTAAISAAYSDLFGERSPAAAANLRAAITEYVPARLLDAYEAALRRETSAAICYLDAAIQPPPSARSVGREVAE